MSHELYILFVTEFVCKALLKKISAIVFQVIEWPWVNHFMYSWKRMCWRGCALVAKLVRLWYGTLINVDTPGCYYVSGSRHDRAQVGRFYSCTHRFPRQKCLLLITYMSLNYVLMKEAIPIEESIHVAPKEALEQNSALALIRLPSVGYWSTCYYDDGCKSIFIFNGQHLWFTIVTNRILHLFC